MITAKNEVIVNLFLLSIFFSSISCRDKGMREQEYFNPIHKHSFIQYIGSIDEACGSKINPSGITPSLIKFNNKEWLGLLGVKNDHLFLYNIYDITQTDSIRLNIPDTTKRRSVFLLKDQYFIAYEPYRLQYSVFQFSGDSLLFTFQRKLPRFLWKEYSLRFGFGSGFCVLKDSTGSIVMDYGKRGNKKYNYLDPEHNLVIFTPGNNTDIKTGRYPTDFFKHKIYNNETLFCNDSNNDIYYTFQMHDSIFKINREGVFLAANVLHENPEFDRFDWDRVMDLGYVRKHTMMSEANLNMCVTPNGNIVVIKQLRKTEYRDKSKYKYFVFDPKLKMLHADTLRHGFLPGFLFPYKKGFMIFANPENKAVYYETN
jgi:hypothetical protein